MSTTVGTVLYLDGEALIEGGATWASEPTEDLWSTKARPWLILQGDPQSDRYWIAPLTTKGDSRHLLIPYSEKIGRRWSRKASTYLAITTIWEVSYSAIADAAEESSAAHP